jgi:hypothetical protein
MSEDTSYLADKADLSRGVYVGHVAMGHGHSRCYPGNATGQNEQNGQTVS